MPKRELDKFRSLTSFGISGVLSGEAEIFYSTLFNSQHIGKISDLLSVRLKKISIDELKLRALIAVSVFQGSRVQNKSENEGEFGGPIVLEVGTDGTDLALGVSFTLSLDIEINPGGMPERIKGKKPTNLFETVLAQYQTHSDQMIVKFEPESRKVELISFIDLNRKSQIQINEENPIDVFVIEADQIEHPPAPKTYTDLGDLDYSHLLGDEEKPVTLTEAPQDLNPNVVQDTANLIDEEEAVSIEPSISEDTQERVKSSPEKVEENVTEIMGQLENEDSVEVLGSTRVNDEVVVKGSKPEQNIGEFIAKIRSQNDENITQTVIRSVKHVQPEMVRIKGTLKKTEQGSYILVSGQNRAEVEEQRPALLQGVKDRFRKLIQKFSRSQKAEDPSDEGSAPTVSKKKVKVNKKSSLKDAETDELLESETDPSAEVGIEAFRGKVGDPIDEVNKLAQAFDAGTLDTILTGFDKEIKAIVQESKNPKAARRFNEVMTELVAEKTRLSEMTKKVNLSVRLKELEFGNKLEVIQNELKKKESLIAQRDGALLRSREQMAQMSRNLEKLEDANSQGPSEVSQLKSKLTVSQKMMRAAKDENLKLSRKLEDLKSQLAAAATAKAQAPVATDKNPFKDRYEQVLRQIEEYRKVNRQLQEKFDTMKQDRERAASPGQTDELKKRLEAAMKLTTVRKKEVDELRRRLEISQKQESTLKAEALGLQKELANLKLTIKTSAAYKANAASAEKIKKGGGTGSSTPRSAA